MDYTTWKRLEPVLTAALERPIEEQARFLDQACDGDPHLRARAERLIASEGALDSFLERPAITSIAGAEGDLGRRIGGYRLQEVIAEGGMGVVYLAERDDDQYQKQVAIKLVRRGLATAEITRRFRTERQILAALEHLNIARLYDGGTTDDGIPFLVMEYIVGQPIDLYCEQHRLSVRDRLRLFQPVCAAVQLAHNHFLVHRDLKPENILVTEEGVPKLLDFGIAKALASESSSFESSLTLTGQSPMTPAYASPEQIRGEPVTTASDVYSLGVLLFRLLTGRLPYGDPEPPPHEVARAIVDNEPPRPSAIVGTRTESSTSERQRHDARLRRALRGDLDNIVLKALSKDRSRRYSAVSALAADIERYLTDRPVAARRASLLYRGRKLIHRYRLPIAASAAVGGLAFAATLAGSYWRLAGPGACGSPDAQLAGIWDEERRDAVRSALAAEGQPAAAGVADRFIRVVDRYATGWTTMHGEACVATRIHGKQSERLLDLQLLCLDDRRAEMAALVNLAVQPTSTANVLKAAYNLSDLSGCADTEALLGLNLPVLDEIGQRQVSRLRDRLEGLRARYRAGQAVDRPVDRSELRATIQELRDLGHRPLEAAALDLLADILFLGGIEGVVEARHEALRASIVGGDRRLTPRLFADLAKVVGSSLLDFKAAGNWGELAEAALAPLGDGRDEVEFEVLAAIGLVALVAEDHEEAARRLRRALALGEQLWGPDDARLGPLLNNLYVALRPDPHDRAEATRVLTRAVEVMTAAYGPSYPSLIPSLLNIAAGLADDGRYDEALEYTNRCRQIGHQVIDQQIHDPQSGIQSADTRLLGAYSRPASQVLLVRGQILNALDRSDHAAWSAEKALELIRNGFGERHPAYLDALVTLAETRLLQLRIEEAGHLLADAFALLVVDDATVFERADAELLQGRLDLEVGNFRGALDRLSRARSLAPEGFSHRQDELRLLISLGQAKLGIGDRAKGRALLEEALATAHPGSRPALLAETRFTLARHLPQDQLARAVELVRQAHDELTPMSPRSRRLQEEMAAWLKSAGIDPEAHPWPRSSAPPATTC